MDWAQGIQRAIDFIEDHLTEEIDYAAVARQAACSNFYFQRIFSALCGIPMGEYIRSRRLTLAGSELAFSDMKVIDAALKYGYESPESFARAFSRFHGFPPSEAKRNGAILKNFSRLAVQITLKGGNIMNYRIEEKAAFDVIQRVERHHIADSQHENSIPGFWTRIKADGTLEKLLSLSCGEELLYGICYGNSHAQDMSFDYGIAARCRAGAAAPEGMEIRTIPARTWMIFECSGSMPQAIQALWHSICTEFFPTSVYEPTYEMDLEVYPDGDMTAPDYRCELWLPVRKK